MTVDSQKITQYPKRDDLDRCDSEPIHLISRVQEIGFLLVIDADGRVIQTSESIELHTERSADSVLGKFISEILNEDSQSLLNDLRKHANQYEPLELSISKRKFICLPHVNHDGVLLLDFEPSTENWEPLNFQQRLMTVYNNLSQSTLLPELLENAARKVRELLGYDRVMIYQFDKDWNGVVAAEDRKPELESWLNLHYPAGDIPAQARALFLQQGVRIIADVDGQDSKLVPELNPKTEALLDIGKSQLRSSSRIHIEYLQNMEVNATLTCAIVREGKLWGLIACHHYSPKHLPYQQRQACQMMSVMISNLISAKESDQLFQNLNKSSSIRSTLVDQISKDWDILNGLTAYDKNALDMLSATGFVVRHDGEWATVGNLPDREVLAELVAELGNFEHNALNYYTDCITDELSWMEKHRDTICGVLFYRLSSRSDSFMMWVRPEYVTTIDWGGNPDRPEDPKKRLSPRKSFEKFSKETCLTSKPWDKYERDAASALVNDIRNIIVSRYGEIQLLNSQLQNLNKDLESFSYSVSHDLRSPLRGIDGFAQILLEDYADVLDDEGKQSLNVIIKSADRMNQLIDDILHYSGLAKRKRKEQQVDLEGLIQNIIDENEIRKLYPITKIEIMGGMPKIFGDHSMLYQLFANLLLNACKYSQKKDKPKVEVGYLKENGQNIYFVKDNGIGFEEEHAEAIFNVFTRLVTDEFQGTGIGLAICKRVVENHDGKIWAESPAETEGAIFKISLTHE